MLALQSVDQLPCYLGYEAKYYQSVSTDDYYDLSQKTNVDRVKFLIQLQAQGNDKINQLNGAELNSLSEIAKTIDQIGEESMDYCRDFYHAQLQRFHGANQDSLIRASVSFSNDLLQLVESDNLVSLRSYEVVACPINLKKYSAPYREAILTFVSGLYGHAESSLNGSVSDTFELMERMCDSLADEYGLPHIDQVAKVFLPLDCRESLSADERLALMGFSQKPTQFGDPIEDEVVIDFVEAAITVHQQKLRMVKASEIGNWKKTFEYCVLALPKPTTQADRKTFHALKHLTGLLDSMPDRLSLEHDECPLSRSFFFAFHDGNNEALTDALLNEQNESYHACEYSVFSMIRTVPQLLDWLTATAFINSLSDILAD
ncbi:hypothetical protein LRP52_24010 [Photobacterium sp. ZSDE20]|uniref:Uncharacterized protein n=1 Tax=Photobacterium pectinilyticum TaxID=2906793 RepID=A0ABT1N2Q9_9GAMM|nr:hypothetical protein [Photobacterium sp. ZSDE20]MCQ1058377.1 hypothetical protein [Photobacterium sp. ZSDE20]MDD1825260.1 hypothetical protein [Photobacterium sp. ZSDE20]